MIFAPFFKKGTERQTKRYYAAPSLNPSLLERSELLNLALSSSFDTHIAQLRNQARALSVSNPIINGYFQTLEAEIFGDNGIILDLHSPNAALNKKIETLWTLWREQSQAQNLDFWNIESLSLLYLVRDGECFLYVSESEAGLKLTLIEPENIDTNINDEVKNIKQGIQFDAKGTPIFYFIENSDKKVEKVSAEHILHIFKPHAQSQVRGLTHLSAVIYPCYQKDKFKSAELKLARLKSEITAIATREEESFSIDSGKMFGNDEEPQDKHIIQEAQVGKINYLDDNVKLQFTEAHNATNMEFFIKQTDREVAKSLGISYSTLTGDLSDVNYSSIRHGGSEQRRVFRKMQHFIIRKLHNKIFEKWLINELKRGQINTKEYETALHNYTFKAQGWEYIDPAKEMSANKIALQTGQKTLMEILREKGKELDTHLEELKKEEEVYKQVAINQTLQGVKK
ncbi:phage portal protein [Helicobacter jaachi]|uniref:Phage portal protein n=1 Tax=Helicobacter jaachi TaxID=1677920 RepID=A0A4U8TD13_9HELI|nr:phage portal protein [Helicobacter jaachi]